MEQKIYKIENIIEEISMGPFGSDLKKEFYTDYGIPVLNGSNLQGFKLGEESFGYVTEEKANSLKKCNAHKGDIIVTHRGTLGQMVYVPTDSKYERYLISQSQFRFRLKKEIARPDYVTYYFHTQQGQYKLLSNASQVGVPALARATSTFRQLEIPLPSIENQNKIMDILLSLDAKIENNNKINANLEAQAAALFKSWFVDFEPFKDGEFVESELGMIPKGWKVDLLGSLIKTTSGGTPSRKNEEFYSNGDFCWVKSKELCGGFVLGTEEKITENAIAKSSAKLLPEYSTLIAMYGATVGEYGIISKQMTCNQAICALLPNDNFPFTFLFMLAKNMKEQLMNMAVGSAQQNISQVIIKNIPITYDLNTIKKYHSIVKPLMVKIKNNTDENQRLSSLRDTLLPKLMSGEIDLDKLSKM